MSELVDVTHRLLGWLFSWTSVVRRVDGSGDFIQDWAAYKTGFGSPAGEYWFGNEYLHYLTNTRSYTLRFDLEDWDGETRYAVYASFRVTSEADNYRLLLGDYSGTASSDQQHDTEEGFLYHNNSFFSTYDNINDECVFCDASCIGSYGYGGFWLKSCMKVGATNRYLVVSQMSQFHVRDRIRWDAWRDQSSPLKTLSMKLRPVT